MKQFILSVCLLMFLGGSAWGQTILSSGDVVIVTANSDGSDTFDFAPLVDLESGTVIKFTECAFTGTALNTNEGTLTFTASTAISSGSIISYSGSATGQWSASGIWGLSTSGDNIIVYQGESTSPTYIYVIGWGSSTPFITTGSTSSNNTYVPTGLSTESNTALSLGTDDNYQYNSNNGVAGTREDILALVSNSSNWISDNTNPYSAFSTSFVLGALTTPVVTIASASQIGASSPEQNTDNVILSFFDITVADAAATLESLAFTTSGTYAAADIKTDGFKLWKDSDATFSGATQIGSSVSSLSGNGETITFSSLNQEIADGSTAYFWITADIAADATVGNTISADAIANTDLTFSSADKSGSVTAGGTQTIAAASVPLIVVSETTLSDFGDVVTGNSSGEATFTVSGDNLTDAVTVTAPTGFEVSTSSGSGFGASVNLTQTSGDLDGEPVTVYVRFSPATADGAFSGNVTIESDAIEFEFTTENVAVSGNALDTEPTTQASAAAVGNATTSTLDLSWTRGDGDSVLVVMKSGSAVDADPSDAATYTANAAFGSGTQIGTGNYVVYNGTGTSVTVNGLTSSTTYHIAVYEYNEGTGTSQNYNVTGAATASGSTNVPEPVYLIISEVADPWDNANAKFVEIFNAGESAVNFTTTPLYLIRQANGGSIASIPLTGSIESYSTYVIAYSQSTFSAQYGFEADLYNGSISGNGDDAYWICTDNVDDASRKSTIIDIYGVLDQDGTGFDWEYLDGRAVRNKNIKSPNSTWTSSEWIVINGSTNADSFNPSEHEFGYMTTVTGTAGWRMLSSPVQNFTVSQIADNTAIQGIAGGSNESFTSNFYYYGSTGTWKTPYDIDSIVGDGYGFIVKFFNNTEAGSSELPITLDVTGDEPSNDVSIFLNKSSAVSENETNAYYTLTGNPFAANLDLSSLSVNNSGTLGTNVAIWDNSSSDYALVSTATGIIEPWQGFWVYVLSTDNADALTIPITGKTSSTSSVSYFKSAVPMEGVFTLSHEEITSQPFKILLNENASLDFDVYDFSKFTPLSDTYAVLGGRQVANSSLKAIESLPYELPEAVEIVVSPMIKGKNGEFTLNWSAFESFPEGYTVTLYDSETEMEYDLREAGSIKFTFSETVTKAASINEMVMSGGTDRFKVTITPITTSNEITEMLPTEVELSQNYPNPFNPSTSIGYALPAQSEVRLTVYDMLGREVSVLISGKTQSAGRYSVQFDASALSSGMYLYRLQAGSTVITKKLTLIK